MKGRNTMPPKQRFLQSSLVVKIFLGMLAGVYVVYLAMRFVYPSLSTPSTSIVEHPLDANSGAALQYWTTSSMQNAVQADEQVGNNSDLTAQSSDTTAGKAAQQPGQPPTNGEPSYPLSTVGKVFMTNDSGQNMVCSGTAIISANQSVVDTAGHCLYWNGSWVKNVVFCPLYNNGNTPYGCWAARDLEVPADWLNARNDFHHDMGMAVVASNSQGTLTDVVGGAGWAYNQSAVQSYSAYGYPAAPPFNGQTRQSCQNGTGKSWQHGGGVVVSIPCNMTGGSSGGPWFVQIGGNWYLDGHNDFTSSMQPGHMFSPYYDDTWYALYQKAQKA
jgi:V8-like Glu-specific endopeptidase